MQVGALLQDARSGQARFRVEELLCDGKNYQIALAADTHMDDKRVCLKGIEYHTESLGDAAYVAGRRAALAKELEFLTVDSHLLPEPLDYLGLDGGPVPGELEPVLVYEYQHGQTLHELVRQRHPNGLAPPRALRLIAELARFAGEIHDAGWIFRDFDPRHVVIGFDDIIHVVGCGNAVRRGDKLNVYKMNTSPLYTAPEIRRELSGKVVRPACDIYSLGCLLSFLLTGIEPQPRPESPLDADAFDMLRDELPTGYKLLVARCLQPLSQKRFTTAAKMIAYCTPQTLPAPTDEDFGMVMLPTPWSGPEGMDNRALRSKLSPGPLVSDKGARPQGAAGDTAGDTTGDTTSVGPAAAVERPTDDLPVPAQQGDQPPAKKRSPLTIALVVGGVVFVLLAVLTVVLGILAAALGYI